MIADYAGFFKRRKGTLRLGPGGNGLFLLVYRNILLHVSVNRYQNKPALFLAAGLSQEFLSET